MQPDPSLVGHFKMDEASGNRLQDVSGYGNDADIVGSPAWTNGVKKLALELDGASYGVVSDQGQLNVTTGLTISGWIQPMAQTDQELISRAGAGIDGYTFGLSSSTSPNPGTVFLHLNQATFGDAFRLSSLSPYPTGGYAWVHVAATYDGSTMRMYHQRRRGKLDGRPRLDRRVPGGLWHRCAHDGTRRFAGRWTI